VFEKLFGYIAQPTIAAPGTDVPRNGSLKTARSCALLLQYKRSLLALRFTWSVQRYVGNWGLNGQRADITNR
jgi:hypothetical protein